MASDQIALTRALIERVARLAAHDDWDQGLNPAQVAALGYVARANRFSRSPSHLADYLGATRGTVSQTMKALVRKGLVVERRSDHDKRSISFDLTDSGRAIAMRKRTMDDPLAGLPDDELAALNRALSKTVLAVIRARGARPFGICRTCRHHRRVGHGGYCRLLKVDLKPIETGQICHEHDPGPADDP